MTELLQPAAESYTEHEQTQEYGVNDAFQLLINSFRFSQGETILQKNLLERVGNIAGERLKPETIQQAVKPAAKAALKITSNSKTHTVLNELERSEGVKNQVQTYADYLADHLGGNDQSLGYEIAKGIIERDYKFLINRQGRNRTHSAHPTPSKDPHLSHFVYYGLMGQSTGSPEYDQIFTEAVGAYKGLIEKDEGIRLGLGSMVGKVVDAYIRHHPEQIDLLPEQYRTLAQAA